MKIILLFIVVTLSICFQSFSQSREAGTDLAAIKDYMRSKDSIPVSPKNKDIAAIKSILRQYNSALEKLDITGTDAFFTDESEIFESGRNEGSYSNYMHNHLMPELKEFKSLKHDEYEIKVILAGNYAFTTETYTRNIVILKDNNKEKRKEVSTSVLKKRKGQWEIITKHNSSENSL